MRWAWSLPPSGHLDPGSGSLRHGVGWLLCQLRSIQARMSTTCSSGAVGLVPPSKWPSRPYVIPMSTWQSCRIWPSVVSVHCSLETKSAACEENAALGFMYSVHANPCQFAWDLPCKLHATYRNWPARRARGGTCCCCLLLLAQCRRGRAWLRAAWHAHVLCWSVGAWLITLTHMS